MYLSIIYIVFLIIKIVNSKNILGLMGCASHSHELWNRVIFNELAAKGYNLTILAVDISENHPDNVHYIHLEETYNSIYNDNDKYDIFESITSGSFQKIHLYYKYLLMTCRGIIRSKGFKTLQNYPNDFKFDLILFDVSMRQCLMGFIHKFNYPPTIGISAFKMSPEIHEVVGGHYYSAYIPHFSLSYDVDMSFFERLHNTILHYYNNLYKFFIYDPRIEEIIKSHFTNDTPNVKELDKLTSLVLVNVHPAIDFPEPLPPNVIEVGGLKINEPQPLLEDLEIFLNKSKKGGVLISLGTNMPSEIFGNERQIAILNAISRLPDYNFIWKTDRRMLPKTLPSNVLIRSWIPQADILAHKNLKAFITHSGSLSIQEAIWYGVPMVAIPLFVDQPRNAHRAMKIGVAEKLNFVTLKEDDVFTALKKVLENFKYSEKAKEYSTIFRDRPMKPLNEATWWIEYTMRHSNLKHLKSPTLELGFIRSNAIDVNIFILTVIIVILVFIFKMIILFCRIFVQKESNMQNKYEKID